jgi:hypothetical protein
MTRYLWHFNAYGWPLERIDTLTGEHVPVISGVQMGWLRLDPMVDRLPALSPRRRGWHGVLVAQSIWVEMSVVERGMEASEEGMERR